MKKLRSKWFLFCISLSLVADAAFAAVPTPVRPSTNPSAGDWLGSIKGYAKDGFVVLGAIISTYAFLAICHHLMADLNEVRKGRKEMGELGAMAVTAAVVLMMVVFFVTQSASVIS